MFGWLKGGLLLGVVFFAAVLLAKPVGVSTEFAVASGWLWSWLDGSIAVADATAKSGFASSNAYFDESGGKLAKAIANPLNYGVLFVLAMAVGAFVSARLRGGVAAAEKAMPGLWRANFGNSTAKRYAWAFVGGFIVLYGARLAGGCTSGHMMSGMMQTALSGYLFAVSAFAVGIPVALMLYKKEK
ncbi:MAG: YeeE/YedE family protein [Pseudomonadaceae bacterium]|nr:YeeE/YedE family protein [Pseudomonadaceae bacterium]